MTRVILNGTIKGLRGKMGNLIFRQMPDGTTVVTRAPAKKTGREKKRAKLKRSEKQKAQNSRFQDAVYYARAAQTQPIYAELAALAPMKTAYNIALSDWFNPPVIACVERTEDCIRVQASDAVMVKRVQVTVMDEKEGVLEKGEAVRVEGDWWEYASQAAGKRILAEAWDLPGNITTFVLE